MKAVSEIRKDSIRITDKEGYDVKNIKQKKKIENHHWKKKYLQTYLPIFQKEKETFFFFEKKERKRNLVFKKDSQKSKFTRN